MHRRDGKLIVAATDLVGFLECGHLTKLDLAAADKLIHKPDRGDDPEVALLQRRGGMHEQRYIDVLRESGRVITDLSGHKELSYAEQHDLTVEAMRRGDDVIYQGAFFDGRWIGFPDFLLRVPGASSLGDYHYEVADTKLAHSAKASALIQICSYVDHLARIQETTPENVYVVTGGETAKEHSFRTAEMMAYYRLAKSRFEDALDQTKTGVPRWPIPMEVSYPDPVEHCGVCRFFYEFCRQQWRDDDALPLVAGITRTQRKELAVVDIRTRTGLATAENLDTKLERVHHQARVQVASDGLPEPVYEFLDLELDDDGGLVPDRGLAALPPPSPGDLFFDIEGDAFADWVGLEYLFGIWEPGMGGDSLWDRGQWHRYWALDQVEEKKAFEDAIDLFIGRLEADPNMHIYHYAPYEPTALKRLAARHATREEEVDRLLRGRVLVDLYRVVRQSLRIGVESYSIKRLEPLYAFDRTVDLRDANSSIVEFESYLDIWRQEGRREQKILDTIEEYNRDDCVSAQLLRDWLEERRPEATAKFGIELRRPLPGDQKPPSEDLSERIRQVQEMIARLTANIDPDPAKQSEADRATWLVAHLLDWHRREDKSTWWRYYDLLSKSDEELIDEPEPISGLEFVSKTAIGGRSRSDLYRYKFPPQEHKIDVGSNLNDPQLFAAGEKTATGTVEAIDDDELTIDIKRGRDWNGPHPASVVANDVIDAKAQRRALMRLAEWVAENGIDSVAVDWQAGRDLLRGRPPRLVADARIGPLKPENVSGTDAARLLALELDDTTLAIQGPPGSGKTYTGARMILDLIRDGRRVGVTSNGHKVIGNLLEAVLEAVPEGMTVRVVQKAKPHEAYDHASVKQVDDNDKVDDALANNEVDLVAGTPWLWARDEISGQVDTLFVDEAGQVSLANVIAISGAARNLVLLGDPQQLDQPTQGVHPDGAGRSALAHLLGEHEVVPPERGLFLERTFRMHPQITAFTSDLFYEGKLDAIDGLERQAVEADGPYSGSGLRWVAVKHQGNTNESPEEAEIVAQIASGLIGRKWIDADGNSRPIGWRDIVIVSPFNAHRLLIAELLPSARVGTVDKFQGQQAPVSIYTMATSRPEDAPRGMGFLFNLHRLNVATSRAKALAIVVASPELLLAVPRTPDQLRMANGLAAFVEAAEPASA